jgi:hypothetical protein
MPRRTLPGIAVMAAAALLPAASPAPAAAQEGAGSTWRLSGGGGAAWILSGHPHMDTGQVSPSFNLGIERSIHDRYALGIAWIATWYRGDFGDEGRHTLAITGSAFPGDGLHLTAGLGPGIASLVTVEGPPADGPGDANVDVFEGEPALSFLGEIGYRAPLSRHLAISPTLSSVTHWLRGQTMTYLAAGLDVTLTLR